MSELRDVIEAYVPNDPYQHGGDSPRAIVLAAMERREAWWAARLARAEQVVNAATVELTRVIGLIEGQQFKHALIDEDVRAALLKLRLGHESPSEVIRRLLPPAPLEGVSPIQQPPAEDLRNATFGLDLWLGEPPAGLGSDLGANKIARSRDLLRAALVKLGEPSFLVIQRVRQLLEQYVALDEREARDIAAVILTALLEGR